MRIRPLPLARLRTALLRRRGAPRPARPEPATADGLLVLTLRSISTGAEPVTLVIHEDDDVAGWSYLSQNSWETEELLLVHQAHLVADDESLAQLSGLPAGRYAARESSGSPWRFGDADEIPTGE